MYFAAIFDVMSDALNHFNSALSDTGAVALCCADHTHLAG